jgi:hypothetical protein
MKTISDPRKIRYVVLAHDRDIQQEMRGEVLAEAHRNFGYDADSFNARGPLAKILSKLEIVPLDGGEVAMYMASKTGKSEFSVASWLHIVATLIALGYVAFGLWHYPHLANNDGSSFKDYPSGIDWVTVIFFSAFPAIMGGVILNMIAAGVGAMFPKIKRVRTWEQYKLGRGNGRYKDYIPVHVLSLANQIKSEAPEAVFQIHELTEAVDKIQEPLPDPFLSVALNNERYFIAVWDEREFEAKM